MLGQRNLTKFEFFAPPFTNAGNDGLQLLILFDRISINVLAQNEIAQWPVKFPSQKYSK